GNKLRPAPASLMKQLERVTTLSPSSPSPSHHPSLGQAAGKKHPPHPNPRAFKQLDAYDKGHFLKASEFDALLAEHNFSINHGVATSYDRKILRKFKRQYHRAPSVAFLLQLTAQNLLEQPGWGKKAATWLREFQQKLLLD